jgi:hypothetical protein
VNDGSVARVPGGSAHPRLQSGASGRPLNSSVKGRVHPVLRFRTGALDISCERPNPINPIPGESLLSWIAQRWTGQSGVTDPAPEDWGWYAHVYCAGNRYMLGASCSEASTEPREWLLQIVKVRTLGERLLGRNKLTADDPCLREVRRLLELEPAFEQLTLT